MLFEQPVQHREQVRPLVRAGLSTQCSSCMVTAPRSLLCTPADQGTLPASFGLPAGLRHAYLDAAGVPCVLPNAHPAPCRLEPCSAGIQYVAPVHEFPEDKWNQVGGWASCPPGQLEPGGWVGRWANKAPPRTIGTRGVGGSVGEQIATRTSGTRWVGGWASVHARFVRKSVPNSLEWL